MLNVSILARGNDKLPDAITAMQISWLHKQAKDTHGDRTFTDETL
ncbi:hypothetical protein [Nostoc sp.]